ncbi:hypothetical protein PMZ80_000848 [Knufia obscura]|uniref:ubiquitinyl hydrolase 1 n=1 Tax=Knufia obscura TaxID=1635080 RepID=A0ABR0S1J4_9EURO|nr:hypothetical protein PMZ80_000848 [Knufia obscura]
MQHSDKASPLKDDLKSERNLRSASPAIKRPASDMGAQEREDDKDVAMADDAGSPNGQSQSGKRQKNDAANTSNPGPVSQMAPSSEDTTVSETTVPSESASTAPTSIMEPTESRPSIDEQVAKVKAMIAEIPQDGSKGYVVSGKWLRKVLAHSSDPPKGISKEAMEEEIGPVDNADIAMVAEDSGKLKDEAGETFTFLRPGLVMEEDMWVMPQAAWDLVVQWYGVAAESPIITRYAHALSEENPLEIQYELHPPVFSFLKVVGTHTPQTTKDADALPPRMVASVHTPFMKWLKDAKELVHTDINTKVRVWKVLGGIKSTSASGILTPAASRSASPAPGAEIIASAGSKMIIDVNTFGLLSLGDQRELIDHKDQTMDSKYNGKIDLRTIGLGRSDVIVLEEQTNKTDEYPSDNPKFSMKGAAKAKNLTVSGRSSPNPSMMTRGRTQREGKPKGIVGLQNLGNTCYMNSALQCIRSVDELTEYFRRGHFKKELNFDNPLGHHGEMAKAYGNFIESIYSTNSSAVNPSPLKRTIGKYGPNFNNYGQQDSQELLAFLLDGLSEDLNRIAKKPYIEKPDSTDEMVGNEELLRDFADRNWNDYKARNDSVVVDLFAGMFKSTLTCPTCQKVSIVFDPFSNLTLQLPIENNWSKEIIFFPLYERPVKVDVDIDKNATIRDVKDFVGQRVNCRADKMICAESYKNKFFKIFDNGETIAETNISANDVICIYELADTPTNYNPDKQKKHSIYSNRDGDPKVDADTPAADRLLIPIYHRKTKPNGNNRMLRSFFAHPSYVVLSRKDRTSYDALFKKVLAQVVGMTTQDILENGLVESTDATPEDSDTLIISEGSNGSESPSASATSVQDEDGMVDVSMRDASQATEATPSDPRKATMKKLQQPGPVRRELLTAFEIKVAHGDDGIATGWNTINENTDFESVKVKAAELARSLAHRPKQSIDDENYDSSASDLPDVEHISRRRSRDSGSESGGSPKQETDDDDSVQLPDVSEISSGKDTRGASKHAKKRTFKRKGKIITGKTNRRTPPVAPQPKVTTANTSELIVPGDAMILDWDSDCFDSLFTGDEADTSTMRGMLTHEEPKLYHDEELVAKRASRLTRKKNGVTLEDCLNEYGKTETLSQDNAWYCPRCKEHVKAERQFELWKVPDVLVMHFKRFSAARNFRDKLELSVDYPVEGLDLSSMVREKSDGKNLIYDLIAVDNHYGGLGGGHYTAYAKNSVTGNWYDYNDSHVSQVKDPQQVVQRNAYLLFYRRREPVPLGGEKLEQILTEAGSDETMNSRDASPSGEGRRLGGSSHNGSSSAFGQPHHVGDGGSANNQQKMKGLSQDQEQDGHMIFHGPEIPSNLSSSDALPSYGDSNNDMLMSADVDEGIGMGGPNVPWNDDSGWNFNNITGVPPSSNVDENEPYASSTGGLGGSTRAPSEDLFAEGENQPILAQNQRESAPPPDTGVLPGAVQMIPWVPGPGEEEDEDLETTQEGTSYPKAIDEEVLDMVLEAFQESRKGTGQSSSTSTRSASTASGISRTPTEEAMIQQAVEYNVPRHEAADALDQVGFSSVEDALALVRKAAELEELQREQWVQETMREQQLQKTDASPKVLKLHIMRNEIKQIVDMGFQEADAANALSQCGGHVGDAITLLVSQQD